jgi:hypothetical protein
MFQKVVKMTSMIDRDVLLFLRTTAEILAKPGFYLFFKCTSYPLKFGEKRRSQNGQ